MADLRLDQLQELTAAEANDLVLVQDSSQVYTSGDDNTLKEKKFTFARLVSYLNSALAFTTLAQVNTLIADAVSGATPPETASGSTFPANPTLHMEFRLTADQSIESTQYPGNNDVYHPGRYEWTGSEWHAITGTITRYTPPAVVPQTYTVTYGIVPSGANAISSPQTIELGLNTDGQVSIPAHSVGDTFRITLPAGRTLSDFEDPLFPQNIADQFFTRVGQDWTSGELAANTVSQNYNVRIA